jgi:hypothetical protein
MPESPVVLGVTEVEQDAQILQEDLLNGEQHAGRTREGDLVSRLAGLVLDDEIDIRVRAN